MKRSYFFLLLLMFSPFAQLHAQAPTTTPEPDTLEVEDERINDLNSGKAVVEESTVMEMLDLVSTLSTTKDIYLENVSRPWPTRLPSRLLSMPTSSRSSIFMPTAAVSKRAACWAFHTSISPCSRNTSPDTTFPLSSSIWPWWSRPSTPLQARRQAPKACGSSCVARVPNTD